jgi:divinyl chlorophyllide a 8-vinyl-reductase
MTAVASPTPISTGLPHAVKRVMLLGATGTVGSATLKALLRQGYSVTCFVRSHPKSNNSKKADPEVETGFGATFRYGDITAPLTLRDTGFPGEKFDAIVSCLASRQGTPEDAWAIDYQAHSNTLRWAKEAGVQHFVLLSAICVQKPRLAFQHAKLAFEKELVESGLTYSIVRATALFKSLSGQIDRLRKGKSFLVFGNGMLTACKPISDKDLANYLVQCLGDISLHNRILPIGGPGPAITPQQQGEELFRLLGRRPRFSHVPITLLDGLIKSLAILGAVSPALRRKAELARIGRYYATESMLVLNIATGQYDEAATPATGNECLFEFYKEVIRSNATINRGDHSVF